MTAFDRIERQLPERIADLALARVPDYFDDLLQVTARTRQRPAWSSLQRWLPMDMTFPLGSGRARPLAGLAILALVALLIVAAVLAFVGSRQLHVPSPFGPAANGVMYYTTLEGDIATLNPTAGSSHSIITGSKADGVIPSRNGLRIAIGSKVTGGEQLSIANADGTDHRVLPGTWVNQSEIDWSPTDAQLAIVSEVAGVPAISIIETDGSAARTLKLDVSVSNLWYLPDGRLVFHGTTPTGAATYGIYLVNADGTGERPIGATSTVDNWLGLSPSEDGKRIVYHKWVDDPLEHGRLHVVDIASGTDTVVQVAGTTDSDEFEDATFSPDGTSILFKWFTADGNVRLAAVPATGGAAVRFGPAVHYDVSPNVLFSPDGKSVIAWYLSLNQLWLLDPTGNGGDRQLSASVSDVPTWQRVAP